MDQGYTKRTVLRIVDISPSTYYYHIKKQPTKQVSEGRPIPGYSMTEKGEKIADEQIGEWIMELIAGDGYSYGYRKLTVLLKRDPYHLHINKKKVYRLCKEMNILRKQREKKVVYPRKLTQNRIITASNQLWETDIKYGYIAGEDRFFFVQSCLDVFDRSVVAFHIGLSCTAEDVKRTLQLALFKRQLFTRKQKPVIRTDNGPQFVAHRFQEACVQWELEHERIPPKTPNMNAHIESFHCLLQDECFDRWCEFSTYAEAYEAVIEYMILYNERRIHSSISDLSPMDFYQKCLNKEITGKVVRL
jgi:putative transposase